MHASSRVSAALTAAVGAAAFGVVLLGGFVDPAEAASCAHVSITPGVQSPTLTPTSATIDVNGCVAYTNNTALPVKVSVGKLSDVANPNGVVTFIERAAGTFAVRAQEQFQGQGVGGNGTGTLVVRRPAPKPSPAPTPQPTPHPSPSSTSPSPRTTSSGPVVAPTTPGATPPTTPGLTPAPNQSGQNNPPVIVGMTTPTPSPPSSPEVIPRAQLQPPSGRAAGLPAAVAALLVVGAAGAFVRVLLAEPAPGAHDRRFVPRAS